jgi:hypothetical protein
MRSIKVATTISSAALGLCLVPAGCRLQDAGLEDRGQTDRLTVKFFESDPVDQSTRNLPGFDETETMKQNTAIQRYDR